MNGIVPTFVGNKQLSDMEVTNHTQHLGITMERLMAILFMPEEFDLIIQDKEHFAEHVKARSRWVKISELVILGVTTSQMVLIHLLWLQSIGRVVVEDIDPYSGAVRLHVCLPQGEIPQFS